MGKEGVLLGSVLSSHIWENPHSFLHQCQGTQSDQEVVEGTALKQGSPGKGPHPPCSEPCPWAQRSDGL